MLDINYKYINYKNTIFIQVSNLRYDVLFKPYGKIKKYVYDKLDPKSFHLTALLNNRVIAYSRLTLVDCKNSIGKISNVAVAHEYSSMGIGHNMLKIHIQKASELGMKYLFLDARKETINFYRKSGFEPEGDVFISNKSGLPLQTMSLKLI
ncbi:MAG: GNAT family N-acetyltransferase [Clostridium sp.]